MSDEPFALSTVPLAPPASGDYDAIFATVMESSRGRWFLEEFARRNRNADTSLVLNAIERIERVIRGDRGQQAYQDFRIELLEMAKTIAVTRAEVAEIGPEPVRAQAGPGAAPPASDAFAAAERIQEVAWTMRERGLEPSTCDQIEALASSILSASALRDPNDRRARKLAEVLQHLERRINAMLDSSGDSALAATAEVEAESDTMPIVSAAERQSAASALPAQDVEVESVHIAEPEQPAALAPAPAAIDDSVDAWLEPALEPVDTDELVPAREPPQVPAEPLSLAPEAVAVAEAPAPEFAIALATELADLAALAPAATESEQQPVSQPSVAAEPQIEVAELELAPLVVVPAGEPTGAEDAPVTELELAPIVVEPTVAPLGSETPAPQAPSMEEAPLPAFGGTSQSDHTSEPDPFAAVEPEAALAAEVPQPGAEAAELELAPLIPAPVEQPPLDQATSAEIVLASEAPAAGHAEPIALELEPIAVSAVAGPLPVTESAPPDTGGSAQPETPAIAAPPAGTAGDPQQAAPALLATAGPGVRAAPAEEPIVATAPAAPLAQEEAPALVQEEQALPHEEPAPPPATALVPDLPERPVELAAEQPAVAAAQDQPGMATPAPLAFEPAAEPFSRAVEPDAVISVGSSAPVAEEPAVAAGSEIATELPLETPAATDAQDRSLPSTVEPARETDMLSAAWETAVSGSEAELDISMLSPAPADPVAADAASVAIGAQASAVPDTTVPPPLPEPLPDATAAAELTDFLLEPLPLPATVATVTAGERGRETPEEPVEESSDMMSEIEEELFAALPIEETVPGLSPQSPDAAQPAFAPAAAILPPETAAAPLPVAEVAQGADGAPQATTAIGTATAVAARTAAKPMPRPAPNDPLAALKAMSDEERIALFT
jgi:hypothetical protein